MEIELEVFDGLADWRGWFGCSAIIRSALAQL